MVPTFYIRYRQLSPWRFKKFVGPFVAPHNIPHPGPPTLSNPPTHTTPKQFATHPSITLHIQIPLCTWSQATKNPKRIHLLQQHHNNSQKTKIFSTFPIDNESSNPHIPHFPTSLGWVNHDQFIAFLFLRRRATVGCCIIFFGMIFFLTQNNHLPP